MADEQIIYLSPEEDLTTVRERLENAQAKRIILIIPPQTQLRSNVSWRLLHTRAQALGKDVLVISSDRQIRTVVKAAGFRVAESQESQPTGGTRPVHRPGRSGAGGRTGARIRAMPGRSNPQDRNSSTDVRIRQREQPIPRDFIADDQPQSAPEPDSRPQAVSADQITHPSSPSFEEPGQQFGADYNFRRDSSPPSAEEDQEFDEHASLVEDFNMAQSIREAAQLDEGETVTEPPEAEEEAEPAAPLAFRPRDTAPPVHEVRDPFSLMEDGQPGSWPEQRGAAPIDELDAGVPDISEYPTETIGDGEIEDLGDEGDVVKPDRSVESVDENADTEEAEPTRNYGMQPRNGRQAISGDEIDEDELPPIERTPQPPPSQVRPSMLPVPAEPTRAFVSQPPVGPYPKAPPVTSKAPAPSTQSKPARRSTSGLGAKRSSTLAPSGRRTAARRRGRGIMLIPAIVIVLLFLAVLAFGYLAPTADVTINLPSQNFSTPLALTTVSNQQNAQTVRSQTVAFDASQSNKGPATGSKQVGTTPATGEVVFTNHSTQAVDIPTNTVLATASGVQFITTSDVLVLTVGSNIGNMVPDPVQAQNPGTSGNVSANSITVIPPQSLSKIAQANGNAQVNVSVTNPAAITNGGLGTATSVTQNDVQTLKTALENQLQQQANAWLAKQTQSGDVAGQPVQTLTDVATPAVGQVAPNGTVSEQVTLHMTVLIVRSADLQSVAQAAFNAAATAKTRANYALAPGQKLSLSKATGKGCTPVTGKTSLTLCYMASGPITPQIPVQQVRDAIAGKTIKDATDYLNGIITGVGGSVTTPPKIVIQPGFFPWLPFWSQHIHIHLNSIPAPSAPKK